MISSKAIVRYSGRKVYPDNHSIDNGSEDEEEFQGLGDSEEELDSAQERKRRRHPPTFKRFLARRRSRGAQQLLEDQVEHVAKGARLIDTKNFETEMQWRSVYSRKLLENAASMMDDFYNKDKIASEVRHDFLLGAKGRTMHIYPKKKGWSLSLYWPKQWDILKLGGEDTPFGLLSVHNEDLFPEGFDNSYVPLSYEVHTDGDAGSRNALNPLLIQNSLRENEPGHPLRRFLASLPAPSVLPAIHQQWREFLRSPFWGRVASYLRRTSVKVKIDKIVCMALGNPFGMGEQERYKSSMNQHLFACALSLAFAKHTGASRPIPIVAFDPIYSRHAMHILSHLHPPIDVVSDPYHYLALTPNSVVISLYMTYWVSAYNVLADLCPQGPVMMFTNEIDHYPWHSRGMIALRDRYLPRNLGWVQQYHAQWLSCESDDMWR